MKTWILVKNNLKRQKFSTVILFLLISLAAMLLISATNVLGLINRSVNNLQKNINSADLNVVQPTASVEVLESIIKELPGVEEYEKEEVIYIGNNTIEDTTLKSKPQGVPIMFSIYDTMRNIEKPQLVLESEEKDKNGIYLPYYLYANEAYALKDKVKITYLGEEFSFVINGFYQDISYASPSNLSVYRVFIYEEEYEKLLQEMELSGTYTAFWVKGTGEVTPNDMEIAFTDISGENKDYVEQEGFIFNVDSMKTGVTMYSQILMLVLLGFAVILIAIAVIVIRFAIISYIGQNYKNLGVMEAAGYTSYNLMWMLIVQFSCIALVGVLTGIGMAFLSKGLITRLLSIASGLHFPITYAIDVVIIETFLCILVIALITVFLSLKIRKLSVLMALRDGINTHNFKKNFVPLDKTKLPLNPAIGLKNIIIEKKQNISIAIIVCILCSSIVLSFTMYDNFRSDNDSEVIWDFIGIDKCNVMLTYDDEKKADEIAQMEEVSSSKKVSYMNGKISGDKGSSLANVKISDDFSNFSKGVLLDGRSPKQENEITITAKVSELIGAQINDTVVMSMGEDDAEFLVVGITQQMSSLGKAASITLGGIQRFTPEFELTNEILLLKEGTDPATFINTVYERFGKEGIELVDYNKIMENAMTAYESSMGMLGIGAFLMTILIVCLVLFLLINMKLLRDRKKNGVFKALGYTTWQVMLQMIISFMPAILIGCVLGVILGIVGCNPMIAVMLSSVGIKKCSFIVPLDMVLIANASLIVISFLVAIVASLKIRKITPVQMLVEE